MAYTFDELKHKKVAELREIAAELGDDAVQGAKQMNKDHLLEALCKAMDIEMHVHHEVVGVDKSTIKSQIRAAKKKRDEAIKSKNKEAITLARNRIRKLKKELRKAMI
jgi:hypothetical protein